VYGYIYETTNMVNGKKYIGKRVSDIFDKYYKGSGLLLRRAIDKYGFDNFKCVVLQECYSNDELNEAEKHWIKLRNAAESDNYYNITDGGDGGNTYKYKSSEELSEIKRKISKTCKKIIHSEDWKKKASDARIGIKETFTYKFTDEHKNKISEANKGKHFIEGPMNKGKKMINKNGKIKYIFESEIDDYINDGWNKGTCRKQSSKGRFI
jgi:group I intron endonuclease